jgi:hypothetical protein
MGLAFLNLCFDVYQKLIHCGQTAPHFLPQKQTPLDLV